MNIKKLLFTLAVPLGAATIVAGFVSAHGTSPTFSPTFPALGQQNQDNDVEVADDNTKVDVESDNKNEVLQNNDHADGTSVGDDKENKDDEQADTELNDDDTSVR